MEIYLEEVAASLFFPRLGQGAATSPSHSASFSGASQAHRVCQSWNPADFIVFSLGDG